MNRSSEKVLSYLAGTENINAVTVDDLQKLAAENPYFPVSQFLLAQKLKSENESAYLLQVQKTALYFSNPFWLHYQLKDGQPGESYELQPGNIKTEDNAENKFIKTEADTIEEIHPVTTYFSENELIAASELAHETLQEMLGLDPTTKKDVEQTDIEETQPVETLQPAKEMVAVTRDTDGETGNFICHPDTTPVSTGLAEADIFEEMPPAAETEVDAVEEEMAGVTHNAGYMTESFLEEAGTAGQNKNESQDDEHDRMFQNIKAMLDASSEEAGADTKNAVISIDPYYTIDYFASQGIKLELEQNPQDQLGQNLKKFTHWLRHMKKLGPEDATEVISRTETDADIQQIADSSNTVREVVTEAMASVLVKQGKKDKAIELYNKLSFLNPGKSAYFADQIKKLKGS